MDVMSEVQSFYRRYQGEKFTIGKSLLGQDIYCFKVMHTLRPIIICQYAIHAREYITALLALKQIEKYRQKGKFGTVYFIPAVNPDGIRIAQQTCPLYKANARGVDLNVNFDARWGEGEKNTFEKGSENYVGAYPFSEPETQAIRDFTLRVKPTATISYHSKGEEIYYEFFQDKARQERDYKFAKVVADCTGYKIKSTPNSCGGYKDWCIEHLKIPAITIEVGSDELCHPIGKERLQEIFDKNRTVLLATTQFLKEENETKIYETGN